MLGKFAEHPYQFTFGNEMLVAPVYEKGAVNQQLFLPEGQWINYWTNEQYTGNNRYTVKAPLQQIPIFIKSGSIIPFRPYAASVEAGSNNILELRVYPGDDGTFWLIEDDGTSNDYIQGGYAATLIEQKFSEKNTQLIIHAVNGGYNAIPHKRSWEIKLQDGRIPLEVRYNGEKIQFKSQAGMLLAIKLKKVAVKKTHMLEIIYP